tara:strand:+ start:1802 stop:2704 length:903 start_codon:yes stop_codon:yes gene_type:complete
MIKTIGANSAREFSACIHDINFPHQNDLMWEKYGVPAIIPGLQLLFNALGTVNKDGLERINAIEGNFTTIVPVGSEIDFSSKRRRGQTHGLFATTYGDNSIGERRKPSRATKAKESLNFFEGAVPVGININDNDLNTFRELTDLPEQAVPAYYAMALSTPSIGFRIDNPGTPSWWEIHNGYYHDQEEKRKVPTYKAITAFLPDGIRDFRSSSLVLKSAIRRSRNVYDIDTICQDGNSIICGVRSTIRQTSARLIIRSIRDRLEQIKSSGRAGSLMETIQRMENYEAPTEQPNLQLSPKES